MDIHHWFYLLLAFIHNSWETLEPIMGEYFEREEFEGLGDLAFAGFSSELVRFALSLYDAAEWDLN